MTDDEYEPWPTIHVERPLKGAALKTSTGRLIGYIMPDGTKSVMPGMEHETIAEWEAFGVYDPREIKQLEQSIDDLINNLAKKII